MSQNPTKHTFEKNIFQTYSFAGAENKWKLQVWGWQSVFRITTFRLTRFLAEPVHMTSLGLAIGALKERF